MINVVIVEDEMLVRLGMKMCIDEHSTSMRVVAAISNAEEAIEYFEQKSADVLITDIRLINKTGLELIEQVKPKHPNMIVVVLSCYEDFAYARHAYELGVDRYLLKQELDSEQLPKIIEEIIEKKLLYIKEQHIDNKKTISETLPSSQVQYKVCCIGLCNPGSKRMVEYSEISFPMVNEIIQEILNINHLGECYLRHEKEIFCILAFSLEDTEKQMVTQINAFFKQIQTNIQNIFGKVIFMSLSETFSKLNDVPDYFQTSLMNLAYSFYYTESCIITKPDNSMTMDKILFQYPIDRIVKEDGISELTNFLESYFAKQKEQWVTIDEVKLQLVKFMHDFTLYLEKYYQVNPNLLFEDEYKPNYVNIDAFDFASPLQQWVLKVIIKAKELIREKSRSHGNISEIIQYIEKNYIKDISLETIADEFHMSKVYLCQYFKKETGCTIINYLNCFRIEQAKILLKASNDTEETISQKVGIENVNYFIRLFKKITNETISEFKNNR